MVRWSIIAVALLAVGQATVVEVGRSPGVCVMAARALSAGMVWGSCVASLAIG